MLIKSKSGKQFEMPSDEEELEIKKGIAQDSDSVPLTDDQWEGVKPVLKIGRPFSDNPKKPVSIRLSSEVLEYFRATGKGWQTRMDEVLKNYVATH